MYRRVSNVFLSIRAYTPHMLAACCLWLLAASLQAQPVVEYFQSLVPVASQGANHRQRAAEQGLKNVLVRVSGSHQVLENPDIKRAIGNAQRYIAQFEYQTLEQNAGAENEEVKDFSQGIVMNFSPEVVEKILRDASQPFWPVNRPNTLVWLVVDDIAEGKILINSAEMHALVTSINESAQARGLPLRYPILDLEDQMAVSAEDVWALKDTAIRAASSRYLADVILVGRFSETSNGTLRATWQYFHGDEVNVYDSRASKAVDMGAQAINPLANFLARRYAFTEGGGQQAWLMMHIDNIQNFEAYAKTLKYLEGVAAIEDITVVSATSKSLRVSLRSATSIARLANTFSLDSVLVPSALNDAALTPWQRAARAASQGTRENPLRYRVNVE